MLKADAGNLHQIPRCEQGVASAMIAAAHEHARSIGVRQLYVHVAVDNESAMALYQTQGHFEVEQKENVNIARSLNRPRRLLLTREV